SNSTSECKSACSTAATTTEFVLNTVHVLMRNIEAKTEIVVLFRPVQVCGILPSWIVPNDRPVRGVQPERREVANGELWPTALVATWTIGAWNAQKIRTQLFLKANLLGVGIE